jgi:hypothetical protein
MMLGVRLRIFVYCGQEQVPNVLFCVQRLFHAIESSPGLVNFAKISSNTLRIPSESLDLDCTNLIIGALEIA